MTTTANDAYFFRGKSLDVDTPTLDNEGWFWSIADGAYILKTAAILPIAESNVTFSPTTGHAHTGSDSKAVSHTNLGDKGTNTHAQIDTFIGTKAQASGLASLDGSSLVVQNPANATATPTGSKILIADANGHVDGWVSDADATTKGKIQLAGDLGGTAASPTIVGIHSGATALAISTITDGEFLKRVGTDVVSSAGGVGETNTASNLGGGVGVYEQKSSVDLQFNSLETARFIETSNVIYPINEPDVVGGCLEYVSVTSLKYAFAHNNQITSHNGTNRRLVKLATEPTLASTANDIAGVAQTYDVNYDVFSLDDTGTAISLISRKWAVSTAGASSRTAAWVTGTGYKKGDVRSNGTPAHYYLCKHDHTSGASTEPGVGANWADEWTDLGVATGATVGEGLYRSDGILVLGPNDAGTNPIDGRRYRWLGMFRCVNATGAKFYDQEDNRLISNFYNPTEARLGKTNPYSSDVYPTPSGTQGWNNSATEWRMGFLQCVTRAVSMATNCGAEVTGGQSLYSGIAMDSDSTIHAKSNRTQAYWSTTGTLATDVGCTFSDDVPAGYHYLLPLASGAGVHNLKRGDKWATATGRIVR